MSEKRHEFLTIRTSCGRGRVTYRADWDSKRPWLTYAGGVALQHFATPRGAMAFLERRGFRFSAKSIVIAC